MSHRGRTAGSRAAFPNAKVIVQRDELTAMAELHPLQRPWYQPAAYRDVPPRTHSRIVGGRWEVRTRRGWSPTESPVERTARDAERLRRWLGGEDKDFVVKIHAAVVSEDERITRIPSCAALRPDELPAWIAGLPNQRGLTESRFEELIELIRSIAPVGR